MKDWNDRVVVVTGASAGVGRAVARLFAQRGASLGLLARGVDGLERSTGVCAPDNTAAHRDSRVGPLNGAFSARHSYSVAPSE